MCTYMCIYMCARGMRFAPRLPPTFHTCVANPLQALPKSAALLSDIVVSDLYLVIVLLWNPFGGCSRQTLHVQNAVSSAVSLFSMVLLDPIRARRGSSRIAKAAQGCTGMLRRNGKRAPRCMEMRFASGWSRWIASQRHPTHASKSVF